MAGGGITGTPSDAGTPDAGTLARQRHRAPVLTGSNLTRVGLRATSADDVARLGALGVRLPAVGRAGSDPRNDPAYIDQRLTGVGYGIYRGGYTLFVSGQDDPLLVPEHLVRFADRPVECIGNVVHFSYAAAVETLPPGPVDDVAFAYYQAPGGGHVVVPTLFTPATAPATVALIRDTVKKLASHVEEQLTIVAVQVAASGLTRVLVPLAGGLGRAIGGAGGPKSAPPAEPVPPPHPALIAVVRARAAKLAGFGNTGRGRLILDESASRGGVADALKSAGYDVRTVRDIFRDPGTPDAMIKTVAEATSARVVTLDRGHDRGGGFGASAIHIDQRATTPASVVRQVDAVLARKP